MIQFQDSLIMIRFGLVDLRKGKEPTQRSRYAICELHDFVVPCDDLQEYEHANRIINKFNVRFSELAKVGLAS